MPANAYILVPYDGSRESVVTDPSKINIIDNPEKQTELYDRLEAQKINARLWLADSGVLVLGSRDDARKVSNVVASFSPASGNDNTPDCGSAFSKAAQKVTALRPAPTKPSITGGYGGYTPMAA